jgi:5-methylcytosine-specific restriction endonuclease McrA
MPFMKNGKRDYKKELEWENTKARHRLKDREERHKARAAMEKAGKVRKGDGKHVDHKTPLSKGGKNTASNLRVVSAASNTSFARNKDGSLKSQTSKREGKRK